MKTIRLQGVKGKVEAIELQYVKPGMMILWNQGESEEVVSIEPVGKKSVKLTIVTRNGKTFSQVKRRTTLVAAYHKK